jgi:hypothetical protein
MSAQRVEQIIAYGEALARCYQTVLSKQEKRALHEWESKPALRHSTDWPGWEKHIGLFPGSRPARITVFRRRVG